MTSGSCQIMTLQLLTNTNFSCCTDLKKEKKERKKTIFINCELKRVRRAIFVLFCYFCKYYLLLLHSRVEKSFCSVY